MAKKKVTEAEAHIHDAKIAGKILRESAKRDFMQVAREIVEQSIGEQMDGRPLEALPPDKRNPHAVALGSMGGKKGGKARAKSLSAKKRTAIAIMAAKSRWNKG
jgi:hypothetical protein